MQLSFEKKKVGERKRRKNRKTGFQFQFLRPKVGFCFYWSCILSTISEVFVSDGCVLLTYSSAVLVEGIEYFGARTSGS